MPALAKVRFRLYASALTYPGYGLYRDSTRTWFDFASTTAPVFSATPTTVAAALAKASYPGDVEEWVPASDVSSVLVNQFPADGYTYKLFDMDPSNVPPVLSSASSPIPVWISGGTDVQAPASLSLTQGDRDAISADVVAAIGSGLAPDVVAAIFAQAVGGGTFLEAVEAIAAAGAWDRTQAADGTSTTIKAFKSGATRLTSVNSETGRTVTYVP